MDRPFPLYMNQWKANSTDTISSKQYLCYHLIPNLSNRFLIITFNMVEPCSKITIDKLTSNIINRSHLLTYYQERIRNSNLVYFIILTNKLHIVNQKIRQIQISLVNKLYIKSTLQIKTNPIIFFFIKVAFQIP